MRLRGVQRKQSRFLVHHLVKRHEVQMANSQYVLQLESNPAVGKQPCGCLTIISCVFAIFAPDEYYA